MKSQKPLLLQRTAKTFIDLYNSVRRAGKILGIDYSLLHRMSKGEIKDTSDDNLNRLGLERINNIELHRSKK